jgi:hypothetical protein
MTRKSGLILGINLVSRRFGRLTVTARCLNPPVKRRVKRSALWRCRCNCGNDVVISSTELLRGKRTTCGCSRSVYSKHPLYQTWFNIRDRCYNPRNHGYPNYGGRGIGMCARWRNSFETFVADLPVKPGPEYTIDRIDNDGNYEASNCRWATRIQQSGNRRNCIMVGDTNLKEACRRAEVPYISVRYRIKAMGRPALEAIEHFVQRGRTNIRVV